MRCRWYTGQARCMVVGMGYDRWGGEIIIIYIYAYYILCRRSKTKETFSSIIYPFMAVLAVRNGADKIVGW
jgi:hypothetical protein